MGFGFLSAVPTTGIASVVTTEMCTGVLNDVTALIPIVLPAVIGFIALRKGISFLTGILHSA